MNFEFATAARILFGRGSLRQLGPIARGLGCRALVVTGRSPRRADPAVALLRESGVNSTIFSVDGEPALETVRAGTQLARNHRCDVVTGIGGGSAIDASKAIAAMLANEGDVLDYVEIIGRGKALVHPSVPFIAIPTTAGTGAEVTRNAVLSSPEHRLKVSLRSPLMFPRVAIVDPELTLDLPPGATASTGLDALTQLIEAFVCLRSNPLTDALCADGISRVVRSLRIAFSNGRGADAREDMALAGLFSGMALTNAGLGAVHGIAGPLGGMFDAPHGAICAALLPQVMEANVRALRERQPGSEPLRRYEVLGRLLTDKPNASADDAVAWVRQLVADLNIPKLGRYGDISDHARELVDKSARSSSMKANPIALTPDELSKILELSV
ncbi:MAG TPA: iron-containing alcohol dehydrogenase [Verrucomicrobiae bacterium]|nr:iron-containing alcohol dehydrogenase [Verrucomicrobiae bacterium]